MLTTAQLTIVCPFPPKILMPRNSDGHHYRHVSDDKSEYGMLCRNATLNALGNRRFSIPLFNSMPMALLIVQPDNRKRDGDNIQRAFKSGRDAMAAALGFDDNRLNGVLQVSVPPMKNYPGGAIIVTLGHGDIGGFIASAMQMMIDRIPR